MGAKFKTGKASRQGRIPRQNDTVEIFTADFYPGEARRRRTVQVAVVADGMGIEQAGKAASDLTVKTIRKVFERDKEVAVLRRMSNAIREANRVIYSDALRTPEHRGMGAAVVMTVIDDDQLYVAHVGDSRAYLVRDGEAYKLTRDHTRVQDQIIAGVLGADAARTHPDRHQLSRRLGLRDVIDVDLTIDEPDNAPRQVNALALQRGDTVLLCTDGLWQEFASAEDIEAAIGKTRSADQTATRLVELADNAGGRDNITAVVLHWPQWRGIIGWVLGILLLLVVAGVAWALGPGTLLQPETATPLLTATGTTTPTSTATNTETPLPTETIDLTATSIAINGSGALTETSLPTVPVTVAPTDTHTATPTKGSIPTSTHTRTPTRTPQPTLTPTEALTSTPTVAPPIVSGTSTPTQAPTASPGTAATSAATVTASPVITTPLASPVLVAPANQASIDGGVSQLFQWRWNGQLAPGQWFEVRIWRDDDRFHYGAYGATETVRTPDSNGIFAIRFTPANSHSVQLHHAGEYNWAVAVVEAPNFATVVESESRRLIVGIADTSSGSGTTSTPTKVPNTGGQLP